MQVADRVCGRLKQKYTVTSGTTAVEVRKTIKSVL